MIGFSACTKKEGTSQQSQGKAESGKASYTMRMGMPGTGKHFTVYVSEQFKAAIEEATNGDIAVQVYPTNQLGTAAQMIEGVQDASIEAVLIPSTYFAPFAPAIAVMDLPFFVENNQKTFEFLNTDKNPANAYLEQHGFKVVGWLKALPRQILAQKKYESLRDLANQKIWCMPADTLQNELRAYRSSPQVFDSSDITVALDNHTVDGVESDASFMNSRGMGQSAKFLNNVPGTPVLNLFCVSAKWFNALPANYQKLVLDTAMDITMHSGADYIDSMYDTSLGGLQSSGVQLVEPSAAFLAELEAASQSVKDTFVKTSADCATIYQQLQGLL
jgi:C4-dicarboxylate-binding protein DctP